MRTLYLLVSGLLFSAAAHAQLSLRAGTNWASQTPDFLRHSLGGNSLATHSQPGYQVGLTYRLPLGRHWALAPELAFSRERQQVHVSGGSPDFYVTADYDLTQSFLTLPVLARRQWGRVYVEGGPQLSWLVGGRGQGLRFYSGPGTSTIYYSPLIEQAATDSYTRLDAGVCLGLGVRVVAGLGLTARVYQGLVGRDKDAYASGQALPKGGGQAYRQTVQVAVTYELPHQ